MILIAVFLTMTCPPYGLGIDIVKILLYAVIPEDHYSIAFPAPDPFMILEVSAAAAVGAGKRRKKRLERTCLRIGLLHELQAGRKLVWMQKLVLGQVHDVVVLAHP